MVKKQLRYLQCSDLAFLCPAGYQPAQFAELIDNYHQHIIPMHFRQISHEINCTTVAFAISNWQWLQQTRRVLVYILGMLTYLVTSNKAFHIQSQIGTPNMSQQSKGSFSNPKVSCVAGIEQLLKHKLA